MPVECMIVEDQPHGVIADRLDFQDHHIALARHGLALVGRMALHLGARAFHAQIFGRQGETVAALECDRQRLAVLGETQFGRPAFGSRLSILSKPPYIILNGSAKAPEELPEFRRRQCAGNIAARWTSNAPQPISPAPLIDPFQRAITYLRVSVTDRCDFRCVYCMSENMAFLPKQDLLTLEELDRLCSAFIARGVRKLRLTGGEPLVRRGIMTLVRSLSRHLGERRSMS